MSISDRSLVLTWACQRFPNSIDPRVIQIGRPSLSSLSTNYFLLPYLVDHHKSVFCRDCSFEHTSCIASKVRPHTGKNSWAIVTLNSHSSPHMIRNFLSWNFRSEPRECFVPFPKWMSLLSWTETSKTCGSFFWKHNWGLNCFKHWQFLKLTHVAGFWKINLQLVFSNWPFV